MKFMPWLVLVFSLLVLGGGIVGFTAAHSWPSLLMGSIFAVLLFCCAAAMFNQSILGYFTAIGLAFILFLFFSYRFIYTFKFMPGGLMAGISLAVFVILLGGKLRN
jgi:uncharacterized membrane protein (UPF0136 family)